MSPAAESGPIAHPPSCAGTSPGPASTKCRSGCRSIRFRTATGGLAGWLSAWNRGYRDQASGGTPYPDLAGPGADAPLPTAGQMWWRLAVRARLDREHAAARPVVWLQGVAAACGLGLVATAIGAVAPRVGGAMTDVAGRATSWLPSVSIGVPDTAAPLLWLAGGVVLLAGASAAAVLWLAHD